MFTWLIFVYYVYKQYDLKRIYFPCGQKTLTGYIKTITLNDVLCTDDGKTYHCYACVIDLAIQRNHKTLPAATIKACLTGAFKVNSGSLYSDFFLSFCFNRKNISE